MCYEYFVNTGAKFQGSLDEFKNRCSDCGKQTPLTDEEGFFSYFLCAKDFEICRKDCNKHKKYRALDPDWVEFFNATCDRYRKDN